MSAADTEPSPDDHACCGESPGKKSCECEHRDVGSLPHLPKRAASCCEQPKAPASSCCGGGGHDHGGHDHGHHGQDSCCAPSGRRFDWLLWGSLAFVAAGIVGHFIGGGPAWWQTFAHGNWEMMTRAWWGILIGIAAVGLLSQVPKEMIAHLLGRGGNLKGILRATFAGVLLDLCNHGILMVGMQLYRKGASLGQTLAFLVASPWNSLSLTLILIALIGLKWTLIFIALSMLIGILTGWIADRLVAGGILPANPHAVEVDASYRLRDGFKAVWKTVRPGKGNTRRTLRAGLSESRMVLRWIFFGFALAAAIRALVPTDIFANYFGPSLLGLLLTLIATTIIEVCSEGSSPIAADLLNRAAAPGNAFTFLMAGACTDYTEMMSLRETTRSWKATLALPLITTPQVLLIAWLMNHAG